MQGFREVAAGDVGGGRWHEISLHRVKGNGSLLSKAPQSGASGCPIVIDYMRATALMSVERCRGVEFEPG